MSAYDRLESRVRELTATVDAQRAILRRLTVVFVTHIRTDLAPDAALDEAQKIADDMKILDAAAEDRLTNR